MKALCIGINQFKYHPKSSLYGCVNDARDMAGFFQTRGVTDITILTDAQATHAAVTDAIIDATESGEGLLLSISSHGTQVPDTSGDEPDRYDEAFVMHDTGRAFDNLLTDDELFELLSGTDARVEVWLDTCHSGTGVRMFGNMAQRRLPRYLPNPEARRLFPKQRTLAADAVRELRNVTLWTGCRADQVSYDAYLQGRSNGAFTRAWLTAWQAKGCSDRASLHRRTKRLLKEWDFDQETQLEAGFFRRYSKLKFKD